MYSDDVAIYTPNVFFLEAASINRVVMIVLMALLRKSIGPVMINMLGWIRILAMTCGNDLRSNALAAH